MNAVIDTVTVIVLFIVLMFHYFVIFLFIILSFYYFIILLFYHFIIRFTNSTLANHTPHYF